MFGSIGFTELILVLFIVLIIFGAGKLPQLGEGLGKAIKGFLLNEDTYTVQLIDFDSKLESYAKSGLKNYQVEKTSMMPSYQGKLRGEQVDDLVAYLASLRPSGGAR